MLLVLTTLAIAMAGMRYTRYGPWAAVLLTGAVATLLWQAKRVDRASDVPMQFLVAVVAGATLVLELAAGWLAGFYAGADEIWFIYSILVSLRGLAAIAAIGDALTEIAAIMASTTRTWAETGARFGLTGFSAVAVIWLPMLFSVFTRRASARPMFATKSIPLWSALETNNLSPFAPTATELTSLAPSRRTTESSQLAGAAGSFSSAPTRWTGRSPTVGKSNNGSAYIDRLLLKPRRRWPL